MKNSKKGFTLSEVLIVVAIIVIVSAAGMAGIAIAVQDANARGEKIQQLHGEGNWEAEANQKIKENVPVAGNDEVLEESLDTPAPTAGATSDSETLDEGTPTTGSGSTGTDSGSTGTGGGTTDSDTGSTGTGTDTGSTGTSTDITPNTNDTSNPPAGAASIKVNGDYVGQWGGDTGVVSANGSTVTFRRQWGSCTVTFTNNGDGTVTMSGLTGSGNAPYVLGGLNLSGDCYNNNDGFVLSPSDISTIESTFNIKIN